MSGGNVSFKADTIGSNVAFGGSGGNGGVGGNGGTAYFGGAGGEGGRGGDGGAAGYLLIKNRKHSDLFAGSGGKGGAGGNDGNGGFGGSGGSAGLGGNGGNGGNGFAGGVFLGGGISPSMRTRSAPISPPVAPAEMAARADTGDSASLAAPAASVLAPTLAQRRP